MASQRDAPPSHDELAARYLDLLPFDPYPVQEEALLAWFTAAEGVLVCAPTGTGKTLIAEAAMYEALRLGRRAYYTTPLIALTEQKLQEPRATVARWGYPPESVGLVTGNRRVQRAARSAHAKLRSKPWKTFSEPLALWDRLKRLLRRQHTGGRIRIPHFEVANRYRLN
jgi:ATP-dependent helicase YprA (DUF1998 family)